MESQRGLIGSGAKGLMQLTVESATEAKVTNPSDPRQSIFGGARYFRQVYEKIPDPRAGAGSNLVCTRRL